MGLAKNSNFDLIVLVSFNSLLVEFDIARECSELQVQEGFELLNKILRVEV